jgi:hypothetical protein
MMETPEAILRQKGATVVSIPRGKPGAEAGEKTKPGDRSLCGPYLLTPSQCASEPIRPYVVKGLLSRGDHGAVIGLPGAGKSALIPYLGYRTSLGLDFFGHRTRAVPVLYLAAEDGSGMKQRVRALYERMGDSPNFYLQPVPVDFLNGASGDVAAVEKLVLQIRPGLIIVDTIARAFPGLKENDPDQMGNVVRVARSFTTHCESAVLSIHHPPKDGETPRGHSVLNGDLDVTLFLEGTGSGTRSVKMGKNRSGPSDLTFSFALAIHTLVGAADEDGDPITAPVAEPIEGSAIPRNTAKEAKLSDQPAVMLRELRNLLEGQGELICPGAEYPTVRAVGRLALRQRLIERSWFADNLLRIALDKSVSLAREGFGPENRALTTLKRNGFISFNRDWVWGL